MQSAIGLWIDFSSGFENERPVFHRKQQSCYRL